MSAAFLSDERLVDLLVSRAVEGLDPEAHEELRRRARDHGDFDDEALDGVAAAVALRGLTIEPMPTHLRERIEQEGCSRLQGAAAARDAAGPGGRRDPRPAVAPWPLWLAAASVVFALAGWWRVAELTDQRAMLEASVAGLEQRLADSRDALAEERALVATLQRPPQAVLEDLHDRLARSPDALVARWAANEPGTAMASGDVVWDNLAQQGYMRFRGLAANDPARSQYQLWIFDETRDDRYPVDGGVFDIPPGGGEVIVPIHAKLPVGRPALFAVTVEQPGGAVVSDRERLVLVAELQGAL